MIIMMRFSLSIFFCILIFSLSLPVFARQQEVNSPPASAVQSDAAVGQASGPVAVPEPTEKALRYHRSGIVLWLFGTFWGILIPALFLFTGLSARIRTLAQKIGRKWFFVIVIYLTIFTLILYVIDLPLAYYSGFVREHAYGLSNQSLGKWFSDSTIELAIEIVVNAIFLWLPYLLLRRSPKRWWFYTGLLAIPFLILATLIQPIWIDPLFNDFGPMKDKGLETKILALADRAGISGGRVYEVNKSADTKTLNAYVNGFGQTKRIVLWDTTIARMNESELLFVMGHEMGHYVLGHVWKLIGFLSALIMLTLFLIHRTAGWMINRFRDKFGFDSLSDIASYPLIILLFSGYLFVAQPIAMSFTRWIEHESDRFGLEITRNNRDAATAFVKLQEDNLSVPRPHWLDRMWRASHPTLGERIDFCNEYRPWEKGQPLQYEHLFKSTDR
ncbi:MAG: M48 family metallopeptidase [Acidobacteria bacterium]|nr:M48 family metallopeptidase [Acidobacteriota bacterium]